MSYRNKHWISSSGILEDGREFKVEWLQRYNEATFDDPEEVENDMPSLYIDGNYVIDRDWPAEIYDNIEAFEAAATYDREYED